MANQMICTNCGFNGRPVKMIKGSFLIELILWICFLIPGVIYTIWRLTTTCRACPKCNAPSMIPLDTPRGKQLAKEFGLSPGLTSNKND